MHFLGKLKAILLDMNGAFMFGQDTGHRHGMLRTDHAS
jgi:hypothetical protein